MTPAHSSENPLLRRVTTGSALLIAVLALSGCVGGASPLAQTTPTDRLFIQAAAT